MVRELSRHIVADPRILHGAPSIRGTRIPVAMILEQVAEGVSWEDIGWSWGGKVPRGAIAEAVDLARRAFVEQHDATRASAG